MTKVFPPSTSIRRRLFLLLGLLCVGTLLVVNLIWLPSSIKEIRQGQVELRQVSVRLIRDQVQDGLEGIEEDLKNTAQRFRPFLIDGDREGLRLTSQRLLQSNSSFEEIGILDGKGKELIRLSRRMVITDQDLVDRSTSALFRDGMKQEIYWGTVTITETSEPRVALTVRAHGFGSPLNGLVFGVINLKSLWNLAHEFKLSNEGRVYVVDEKGRLIAAADPSVCLRQISFADRDLIQRLMDRENSQNGIFVEGDYSNERGAYVTATGLLLSRPEWGVVIEQPRSVLFAPIRQKLWFFTGLSLVGLLFSFVMAQMLSRRLTEPVIRLREGAKQIGGGNLEYRVSVKTNDEIGELAGQFNRMAEELHASQQATLSALTIPIVSQLSEIEKVLDEVIARVMTVTGAEAASIRLTNNEEKKFVFSVYKGFSEAYKQERPTMVADEGGVEQILEALDPFISEDILKDSGSDGNPLMREGLRSVAYLPLKTPNKTFGLITLASRETGRLSPRKADIFRAVAHQISVAIENAHLFAARRRAEDSLRISEGEARRLARENEVIAGIGRIVSSTLNVEEVYERFTEEVKKLIPFERTAINIVHPKNNSFTITYATGIRLPDHQPGKAHTLSHSIAGEVLSTRSSLLLQLEDSEEMRVRFPHLIDAYRAGFRSIMAVPLFSKDEVIGVLHFRSKTQNAYTERDLRLAERVGNQIAGAIANAQLFAERKEAEEALKKSLDLIVQAKREWESTVDSLPQIICLLNNQGIILQTNRAVERWEIGKVEKGKGLRFHELIHPDCTDPGCYLETFWKKAHTDLNQGQFAELEIEDMVLKRYLHLQLRPISHEEDESEIENASYAVIILNDLTEHKQLEDQFRQSQKMESVGRLAGGVAHDFNNLLTVIRGYSQLSLRDLKEGTPLSQNIEEIRKAADRAADLTRQLLAFSRLQILEFKTVNLNNLVQAMEKMLRRMIGEDIELIIQRGENLGSIKTDPGQMEQVIMNLAVNARDAMPSGGKLILKTDNVYLDEGYARNHAGVKPGYYVKLSVSDTGCGMPPEIRERIFEPFFTTKEKDKGTGLGLSTVYGIIKQSGGNILVYSEPGEGTTFNIYLPRLDEPVEVLMKEGESREIPRGNETVLVVEDEEAVRRLAVHLLKNQGYKVLEAARGDKALLFLEQHPGPIDLILTDVVMPGISGPQLVEGLQKVRKKPKIIYMSGYTDESVIYHGVREGEMNFIQKPFTMETLGKKVREVLDKDVQDSGS